MEQREVPEDKRCPKCEETKPSAEWPKNARRYDRLGAWCRKCMNAYIAERSASARKLVASFKDVPCADCGGRFPSECMDFDHVKGVKVRGVAHMLNGSLDKIMAEMAKCEVVCSNCHRTRTKNRNRAGTEDE